MENRYKEGLRNIWKNARAAERLLIALAEKEEDSECADVRFAAARTYRIVADWVIAELRDADAEVGNGGEDND